MTVAARSRLARILPSGFRLREAPALVEQARMVKDEEEIACLRSAVLLGASLFDRALEVIRPGVRETEVAAEMEYAARKAGAEAMSFETIVASGERSALASWPGFAGRHSRPGIRGLRLRCYTLGLLFGHDPHRIRGSPLCGGARSLPGGEAGAAGGGGRCKARRQRG